MTKISKTTFFGMIIWIAWVCFLLFIVYAVAQPVKADEYPLLLKAKPLTIETTPVLTADKAKGTLTVYWPDTKKTITQPALFGKVKSNVLNMTNYDTVVKFDNVTPSGTFKVTKMLSWRLNEPMLVFIKGKVSVAAIHPLWMGNPDQKRIERLRSETPDDNRITGGCINVDADFFYNVLNQLPDGSILNILPE
jgi:hypothetical protein